MIETLMRYLAVIGWDGANLVSILYGCALATVAAWVFKYPLRVYCDAHGVPVPTFKWLVRLISGIGALVGTELTWPVRGRMAWLAGIASWVIVTLLYKYSSPMLTKFAPWLSSDHLAKDDDET